jgi:Holliday junction resolvasome RuvABC endonuclease subunit
MTIFAFDISLSNTGIVIFDDIGNPISKLSIDTHKEKTHSLKLKKIEKTIKLLKNKYKPNLIVLEESFTRFNKSTQAIYKVRGVVELVFFDIEQVFYHATTIRKQLLGKGNAKKEEVQEYILERYGDIKFDDMDQSDAFAVGLCYFNKKGIINGEEDV